MKTYVALLRGINVGGHNKIKMVDLKVALLSAGFESVTTYIQSGNIVFKAGSEDIKELQEKIKKVIQKNFGLEISVVVLTQETLQKVLAKNPFEERFSKDETELKKLYFMIFCNAPNENAIIELNKLSVVPEEFIITPDVIYLYAANGYGKTKLHNNFFEKKLGNKSTARNLKTLSKLLEICSLVS
ncbi:DUF1697 domain-containing protein [Aquimarina litoralis]|uniref:DUF1697 domain-containing protein n=1 Tax=Aquimarina litoralis TaxID=584605 RepID=A0ABP3TLS5_9FLAO